MSLYEAEAVVDEVDISEDSIYVITDRELDLLGLIPVISVPPPRNWPGPSGAYRSIQGRRPGLVAKKSERRAGSASILRSL